MHEIPAFLLDALRFQNSRKEMLRQVRDDEWQRVLSDWHVARLTLPLRQVCGDELPAWVREQIDVSIAKTGLRFERIKSTYARVAKALEHENVPHLVIKGFSLWPGYTEHPKYRPQSDIDLYCPPADVFCARDCLLALGYQTQHPRGKQFGSEHLPGLLQPHSWVWRGDYFDPNIPISFELHFSWWDSLTTRIHPKGFEDFWPRREQRDIDGIRYTGLAPVDNLGYTAINLLRTILKAFPPAEQLYGLGRFLHLHADDHVFWKQWRGLHPESLRRLQAISFCLAQDWFACRLSDEAQDEVNRLPSPIRKFLSHFSDSMRTPRYITTKDGLWLHLDLLQSSKDRAAVFFQRMVPIHGETIQKVLGEEPPPKNRSNETPVLRSSPPRRGPVEYASYFVCRSVRHLVLFPVTLARGLTYRVSCRNPGSQFLTFFAASFCLDLGMTMYLFLYDIYLLDRGLKEDFVGWMLSESFRQLSRWRFSSR